MTHPLHTTHLALASLFALLMVTTTLAVDAPEPPNAPKTPEAPAKPAAKKTVEQQVENLLSDDAKTVRAAETALMLNAVVKDAALARLMRHTKSEKQRTALTRILMHRFYTRIAKDENEAENEEDFGVIGFYFQVAALLGKGDRPNLDQPGLLIDRTIIGFPGHAQFKPDDVILSFDGKVFGKQLQSVQDFVDAVRRCTVGQKVKIVVHRGGKILTITMKLDSRARLDQVVFFLRSIGDMPEQYQPWIDYLKKLKQEDLAYRLAPPQQAKMCHLS